MGFLGTRGTGDFVADQRPKNWRETILYLYPNGDMPLTAIMSKMKSEQTTDPEFNWWTQKLPDQAATITGVYTDSGLSSGYTSGRTAGQSLFLKMSAAHCQEFRVGHQVLIRDSDQYANKVVAKVVSRSENGASSYIEAKLLEADDNGGSYDMSDADRVFVIGNINEEGAPMPPAIAYNPTKFYNYTQIFRSPLSITRTARLTKLRTGDAYKKMKKEALEMHGIEMEKAFLWGIPTENTGVGGKPERTTQGIIPFVESNVAANVNDFALNSSYSGKLWTDAGGGDDWLDSYLEVLFRFGSGEKLGLCGSGALLGLNKLARQQGFMTLTPQTGAWGMKVVEWVTPYGTVMLKLHPLMSQESTTRNGLLLFEPENILFRYVSDTTFFGQGTYGGKSGTYSASSAYTMSGRVDGTDEEYLTEAGLELHHPDTFMYLNGLGQNSRV
jgi:hypothetical protein